ncbi:MAG TPA: hypothetical protein VGZ00_11550 [Candidatus Baltobacteraceae bacterium]|nr:hypothetical protein [Candidatus Baltobacteraceae bacterium]
MKTITEVRASLDAGRTSSEALVEAVLERIADPGCEGSRTFLEVFAESACATGRAPDLERCAGIVRLPLAGIPISFKEIFDTIGLTTLASGFCGALKFNGHAHCRNKPPSPAILGRSGNHPKARTPEINKFTSNGSTIWGVPVTNGIPASRSSKGESS